jgi:hypothetical protein
VLNSILGRDNGYSDNFRGFLSLSGKIIHIEEVHYERTTFGRRIIGEQITLETGDGKGMKG